MARALDVACLAVDTVLRVDLQPRLIAPFIDEVLIHPRRTKPLLRAVIDGIIPLPRHLEKQDSNVRYGKSGVRHMGEWVGGQNSKKQIKM